MIERVFRAAGYSWRLHCGPQVIEQGLREAVERAGARRAFVICSPSINRRTDAVRRVAAALGDRYAGVFDAIPKDCPSADVCAAKNAALAARADLLIAVGGGSVIVATRAVAIFLGEPGDPFEIMTQYPEGRPAFSPRLLAPKPPIINIPVTPTSAMNRAGTGLKNPDLDHRMEYFDPKTRPQAIFIDHDVLSGTPPDVLRSTATTVFAGSVGAMAQMEANPLSTATGTRRSGWRTAPTPGWRTAAMTRPCAPTFVSRPSCRTGPRTTVDAPSAVAVSPATTRSPPHSMCATRMSGRANRPRSFMQRRSGSRKRSIHDPRSRLLRLSASGVAAWTDARRRAPSPTHWRLSTHESVCRYACVSLVFQRTIYA